MDNIKIVEMVLNYRSVFCDGFGGNFNPKLPKKSRLFSL